MDKKLKVFVSYANKNKEFIPKILKRLKNLQKYGWIADYWYDEQLEAGDEWKKVIFQQIAESRLFLLLVSSDFLASDFIQNEELPKIFEYQKANCGKIIPLIIEECPYQRPPLNQYEHLLLIKKVKSTADWTKAFIEIKKCCETLKSSPSQALVAADPFYSPDRFLNSISHLTTPSIGRRKIIKSVLASLSKKESVVITGYAGIGKSILAGNILKEFARSHPDGLFHYFKLPDKSDPLALTRSILQELLITHFPYTPEAEDINYLFNRACTLLHERPLFLFFDDANDPAALEMMKDIKRGLDHTVMLITSQHENWSSLRPLTLYRIEGLEEAKSLQLFRRQHRQPLNGHQRTHLRKFFRQVEGNPLLIECYAQECRVSGFPTDDAILNNSMDRTWSELMKRFRKRYDQLSKVSQKILNLAGILEKPQISSDLALAITACTSDHIRRLMDQGFIQGTQLRDRFYVPTIYRECCKKIVAQTSHDKSIQSLVSGLLCYYGGLLHLNHEDQLDAEWPNIVKIVDDYLTCNDQVIEFIDQAIGDHLDDPIGYIPRRQHISFLLERGKMIQDRASHFDTDLVARIEKNLGIFHYRHGDYPAAKELSVNAKQRYVKTGNQVGEIICNYLLGQIDEDQSNFPAAKTFYEQGRDLALRAQPYSKLLVGLGYYHLGCVRYHQGYFAEAYRDLNRASVDETVDQHLTARINRRIGSVLISLGSYDDAIICFSRLEHKLSTLGRRRDMARLSNKQALLYLHLKNWAKAKTKIDEALKIFHGELGDRRRIGSTQLLLSIWYLNHHQLDAALKQCEQSLHFARETRSYYGIARASEEMANILELKYPCSEDIATLRRQAYCFYSTIQHRRVANESMVSFCRVKSEPRLPIKAVMFDLIDTLTVCVHREYKANHRSYAKDLQVDRDRFDKVWEDSRAFAQRGGFKNTQERMAWVIRELGLQPSPALIAKFAEREEQYWVQNVKWLPDARVVLQKLRTKGIKMAILANGPSALKGLDRSLGLSKLVDTYLLSCDSSFLKPEKEFYFDALNHLGIRREEASHCLFVGDGTDKELNGARECGLYAVRLKQDRPPYMTWENESTDWDYEVNHLKELLELLHL